MIHTIQVSITLIATGFKRQEESENQSSQARIASFAYFFCLFRFRILMNVHAQAGGDSSRRHSGWFSPSSQEEGPGLHIPEFLQRKGRSGFPRV